MGRPRVLKDVCVLFCGSYDHTNTNPPMAKGTADRAQRASRVIQGHSCNHRVHTRGRRRQRRHWRSRAELQRRGLCGRSHRLGTTRGIQKLGKAGTRSSPARPTAFSPLRPCWTPGPQNCRTVTGWFEAAKSVVTCYLQQQELERTGLFRDKPLPRGWTSAVKGAASGLGQASGVRMGPLLPHHH